MMRPAVLPGFLIIGLSITAAQAQVNVDSLWKVWHDPHQPDTARMQAMDYLTFDHYLFTSPDTAYVLAGELLELADRSKDLRYQAIANNAQGASLQLRGDFPSAIVKYQRTMVLLARLGDSRRLGILHGNMGSILSDLGDERKALAHADTSSVLCEEVRDTSCLGNAYLNSGTSLLKLHDTVAAFERFEKAALLHEHSGDERGLALALGNLGMLNRSRGRFSVADAQLTRALSIAERIGDDRQRSILLRSLGMVRSGQGDMAAAIALSERSLAVAQSSSMAAEVFDAAGTLHDLYKRNGQLAKALAMHELYAQMMDSLHNEKGREELIRNQMTNQFRLRSLTDSLDHIAAMDRVNASRELAEVRAAAQRRSLWLILLAVLVIAGAAVFTILDRRKRKASFEREQALVHERMRIASDMHDDLGAGLSALKLRSEIAIRQEQDPTKQELLKELAETSGGLILNMRQIIWAMNDQQGSLEDLLVYMGAHARQYMDQNGLGLTITHPDQVPNVQLSPQQRRNLLLTVKEALHNVVKHANASNVRIVSTYENGTRIMVADDGNGLPVGAASGSGNGIRNMTKRIEDLGGTFNMERGPTDRGTVITIHIPLAPNEGSIVRRPGDGATLTP